jgi:methylglyoxal synthase
MLINKVGLDVEAVQPGPMGGDAQIGARVVEGNIDGVVFLVDPLDKHPHDPDIQALLRLCNVHNVPLATNVATADSIMVWLSINEPEKLLAAVI